MSPVTPRVSSSGSHPTTYAKEMAKSPGTSANPLSSQISAIYTSIHPGAASLWFAPTTLWYNARHARNICYTEHSGHRHAPCRAGRRQPILAINLVIGELTGFVDDSIQFYFDFLSKDTLAQGANCVFERIAARVRCQSAAPSMRRPTAACGPVPSATRWAAR